MNKRYMDFVPAKAKRVSPKPRKTNPVRVEASTTHRVTRTNEKISEHVDFGAQSTPATKLGIVEDLTPKFINTDTPKRPLNNEKTKKVEQKVDKKSVEKVVEKPTEKVAKKPEKKKSPFINQDKVVKRPLSTSVHRKSVTPSKEEPKGPVTIIAKPEKDAHVSLIITIILTIILGAAAGTVAFLLLPN
ncbi:hypothetical protein IJG89_01895 [Candidatus Saccharibacteria bacterium]|nr:hypothetical protein [Candidatus Saccharibacteria bacterium]